MLSARASKKTSKNLACERRQKRFFTLQRISSFSIGPFSALTSRRPGQKVAKTQALGGSRGSFSIKIDVKMDLDGLPLAFDLTGSEASNSRHFQTLVDIGHDIETAKVREQGELRLLLPIARQRNCILLSFLKILYKARALIGILIGELKRFKRIALRCETTARNHSWFIVLACGFGACAYGVGAEARRFRAGRFRRWARCNICFLFAQAAARGERSSPPRKAARRPSAGARCVSPTGRARRKVSSATGRGGASPRRYPFATVRRFRPTSRELSEQFNNTMGVNVIRQSRVELRQLHPGPFGAPAPLARWARATTASSSSSTGGSRRPQFAPVLPRSEFRRRQGGRDWRAFQMKDRRR